MKKYSIFEVMKMKDDETLEQFDERLLKERIARGPSFFRIFFLVLVAICICKLLGIC